MTEQIVSYKTAKLAKEKGFDITQRYGQEASLYNKDGKHTYYMNYGFMYSGLYEGYISAPTQSFLKDWLWETFGIFVSVIPVKRRGENSIYFQHRISDFRNNFHDIEVLFEHQYNGSEEFESPYIALEAGLVVAIKSIKL